MSACDGCGQEDPSERCIGCLHDFGQPHPMTQSSTDSSLVERLRAVETALASDRPYAASVSSEAASRISTLERELEGARLAASVIEGVSNELDIALTAAEAKVARMGEALSDTRTFLSREFGTIDPEINGVIGWIDEAIGPVPVVQSEKDREGGE